MKKKDVLELKGKENERIFIGTREL